MNNFTYEVADAIDNKMQDHARMLMVNNYIVPKRE